MFPAERAAWGATKDEKDKARKLFMVFVYGTSRRLVCAPLGVSSMLTTDDLFGGPHGKPRTDKLDLPQARFSVRHTKAGRRRVDDQPFTSITHRLQIDSDWHAFPFSVSRLN